MLDAYKSVIFARLCYRVSILSIIYLIKYIYIYTTLGEFDLTTVTVYHCDMFSTFLSLFFIIN
ncbi:hypothetical protein BDF21DRAFT_228255 [Thamnidium elegans]|nr:hypothetical protein BDF21DRAFT_228255 [Thamnidium elegans]